MVMIMVVVVMVVMVSRGDHLFLLWILLCQVFWESLVAGDNGHGDVI